MQTNSTFLSSGVCGIEYSKVGKERAPSPEKEAEVLIVTNINFLIVIDIDCKEMRL